MSDLIKALRGELCDKCTCHAYASIECQCSSVWPEDVADEAADRIEALEAAGRGDLVDKLHESYEQGRADARKACEHVIWKEYDYYDELTFMMAPDTACKKLCSKLMFAIQKRGE